MTSKFFRLLLLVLSVSFALRVPAAPEIPPGANSGAPLRFRTLGVGVDVDDLFYLDGQKRKPFSVDADRRSIYYDYSATGVPVSFVRVVKNVEGKEQQEVVGQATVDASMRRVLLVFIRGATEQTYRIFVLKDDISAVPPGGYRVLNFLSVSAGLLVGREKQIVAPGASVVIDPKALPESDIYPFKVFGLTAKAAVPVFSNIFSVDKQVRHLVLIVPSGEGPVKVDVKFLGESVTAILPDDPPPPPR